MQIILLERIEGLGQMGDVVTVKDGYARNFLLPTHKALRSNNTNRALFKEQRVHLEARNLEARGEAEGVAGKLDNQSCPLLRQAGENAQLYGSVTVRDIAAELTKMGFALDRRQVVLARPIKSLGVYPVKVRLHPEVSVTVNVSVARSQEEAERQILISEGKTEQVIAAEAFFETKELAEEAVEELTEDGDGDGDGAGDGAGDGDGDGETGAETAAETAGTDSE